MKWNSYLPRLNKGLFGSGTRPAPLLAFLCAALGLIFSFPAYAQVRTVTLFYTTDAHGHIYQNDNTIGLDRIAALKKQTPHSLLLDAGDFLHGAPSATLTQGREIVQRMKDAGYFAAAAGNHEFSYPYNVLVERSREAALPPDSMAIVSANTYSPDGSLLLAPDADILVNDIKVCVFGLTTESTPAQASPEHVTGLSFRDVTETARSMAKEQRDRGCNLVVALTHLGSASHIRVKSTDIITQAPDIDIVIDGHSHVEMEKRVRENAVAVSSGAHGRHLGRLDVAYDLEAGKVVGLTNTLLTPENMRAFEPDPYVAARLNAMRETQERILGEVVANLQTDLPGGRRRVRTEETAFGDLVADAMRAAYGDAIAMVNGGNLRAGLAKGPVTRGDLLTALPFGGHVVSIRATGREILRVLEHGFSFWPGPDGAFPQISGLLVRLKPENPAGRRIVSVTLADGSALVPDKEYSLSVNDYMASGGDGYPLFASKARGKSFIFVEEAVIRHIKNTDTSVYSAPLPSRIFFD